MAREMPTRQGIRAKPKCVCVGGNFKLKLNFFYGRWDTTAAAHLSKLLALISFKKKNFGPKAFRKINSRKREPFCQAEQPPFPRPVCAFTALQPTSRIINTVYFSCSELDGWCFFFLIRLLGLLSEIKRRSTGAAPAKGKKNTSPSVRRSSGSAQEQGRKS